MQHNRISLAQLYDLGFNDKAVEHRIRTGRLAAGARASSQSPGPRWESAGWTVLRLPADHVYDEPGRLLALAAGRPAEVASRKRVA